MTDQEAKPCPAPAVSDVRCGWCGRPLEFESALADAEKEAGPGARKWDGPDEARAHAEANGRSLVRMKRNVLGEIWAYTYTTPDMRAGYKRNGMFCSLRCGFRFGLAAHRAGYRIKGEG